MAEEKGVKPMFASVQEAEQRYKELQRQLELARKREREAVTSRMDVDETKASVARLQELVTSLVEREAGADDTEAMLERVKKSGQAVQAASEARRAISTYLLDTELEWTDPKLDSIRNLYEAGKYSEVNTAIQQLGQSGQATGGVNADEVAAKVAELLQGKVRVDGGSTTASGGIPTALDELRQKLSDNSPTGREWRKTHLKEVMDAARKGELGAMPSR
ncbi:MAG TPA: hypothetical protein ACFYED_00180 [Candidatus Tripitaka californicus]|uniref:hypothetical protein n=1 Tax=Candidatus Tripitaka californicus TaxID=3367616 RepID=UPI004027D144